MYIEKINARGNLAHKSIPGYIHSGQEVKDLQNVLIGAGYKLPKYGIDGDFGDETRTAVIAFQKAHGLDDDGRVGSLTLEQLKWYWYPNFTKPEFGCKCGKCGGFPVEVNEKLLMVVQNIRNHFGKSVHINSAIRCPAHNKAVGGVSNSQHLYGTAADIKVDGVLPSAVYAYAKTLLMGGVGRYNTFTHVDVGPVRYWRG